MKIIEILCSLLNGGPHNQAYFWERAFLAVASPTGMQTCALLTLLDPQAPTRREWCNILIEEVLEEASDKM